MVAALGTGSFSALVPACLGGMFRIKLEPLRMSAWAMNVFVKFR